MSMKYFCLFLATILLLSCKNGAPKNSKPSSMSREASNKGWDSYYDGNFQEALKYFNQALNLDSTNANGYWGIGAITGEKDDFDKSIPLLLEAIKYDSLNGRIHADLAFTITGKATVNNDQILYNKADSLFVKASRISPDTGYIYFQWAELKYFQENYFEAWKLVDIAALKGYTNQNSKFITDLESKMHNPNQINEHK